LSRHSRDVSARWLVIALVCLLGLTPACGARDRRASTSVSAVALTPADTAVVWTTSLDRDHPLVGRIWSVAERRFVDEATLRAALHGYVFLGEQHDNADHHRLEARLLGVIDRPTVVFEMLDRSSQATIDHLPGERTADALAAAVDWSSSGWPPFDLYRPVVVAALATGRPLRAAGLNRRDARALLAGEGSWPVPRPLGPDASRSLDEELVASHCGMATAAQLAPMGRIQRTRDALMAEVMREARTVDGGNVVLVAGSGHARRDRGVPYDLAASDPGVPRVSVAFVEVARALATAEAYAERWNEQVLPFDFVWFTPRATDKDPCAGMH